MHVSCGYLYVFVDSDAWPQRPAHVHKLILQIACMHMNVPGIATGWLPPRCISGTSAGGRMNFGVHGGVRGVFRIVVGRGSCGGWAPWMCLLQYSGVDPTCKIAPNRGALKPAKEFNPSG